jgi:CheY-like chemotaxis protein
MAGKRILIVDDSKHFVEAMKYMIQELRNPGIESVHVAFNGAEALVEIANHKIDIVFMDIEMPVMNGIEATRQATMRNRFLTVVALTFHREMDFIQQMLGAGAKNYIVKEEITKELLNRNHFFEQRLIQEFFYHGDENLTQDGFREVFVASCFEAGVPVFLHGVSCLRDYFHIAPGLLDDARCF